MENISRPASSSAMPLELGVALTIAQHEGIRHSLRTTFGVSNRALNLRIDPGMDQIFLCEATLSGALPCLTSLTHPAVRFVWLRRATLSWVLAAEQAIGRGMPTLGALERGNCFLTASSRKVPIATFGPERVRPTRIEMEMLGQPNLLEFLRADSFTLEISGNNRRRLTRALAFRVDLQFEVQMGASPAAA